MAISQAVIQSRGRGLVIWLDQDGRGNGHLALMLVAILAARESIPQTEAYLRLGYGSDRRRYEQAAAILHDLGVASIGLLTNSPHKADALAGCGVAITGMVPVAVDLAAHPQLREYYRDKVTHGHMLDVSPGG
jgi:3,4-dihydroxy 2-butanone 4-phosphate synthase/GTP cyclohydrolase II